MGGPHTLGVRKQPRTDVQSRMYISSTYIDSNDRPLRRWRRRALYSDPAAADGHVSTEQASCVRRVRERMSVYLCYNLAQCVGARPAERRGEMGGRAGRMGTCVLVAGTSGIGACVCCGVQMTVVRRLAVAGRGCTGTRTATASCCLPHRSIRKSALHTSTRAACHRPKSESGTYQASVGRVSDGAASIANLHPARHPSR